MRFLGCVLLLLTLSVPAWAAAPTAETPDDAPRALVLLAGDQHSAYERSAQVVALVDRLKVEHPGLPLAVLLNGDTLEYGNVVARRSEGAVDFAMFAALAKRAATVINLGNHEPEFYDLAETVRRLQATGASVVGNIVNRATGQPFAPPSLALPLGDETATIVGVTTDRLSTYRAAVRPSLDLANPVVWAQQNFPKLLTGATLPIVLSHAGLNADRAMLPLLPAGTLFAGAHDHQRFVHSLGRGVYVHSGSWNAWVTFAWLHRNAAGESYWRVEQRPIQADDPADPALAELIRATKLKHLTAADTEIVGHSTPALAPVEAARRVVELLRASTGAAAVLIGNTTFGAGLPAGDISRVDFDACIRFDGTICTAEVDGARLKALLAVANQGPEVPFERRRGEFQFAVGPAAIDDHARYVIATSDWGAKNSAAYFGEPAIVWQESPGEKLKARVLAGLQTR